MKIYKHNNGLFTIKDGAEIDISESKWNFLFNNPSLENFAVYFIGWHLDFIHKIEIKKDLENLIIDLSSQILIDNDDHSKLIFRVKTLNRKDLNELWKFYEYPSIIFLKSNLDEFKLVEIFNKNSRKMIFEKRFCHFYKMDPELDVLWIEKSSEISFIYNDSVI